MTTYYVVHKGRKTGIYTTWDQCKTQVNNYEGAIFKKFTNKEDAEKFLIHGFDKKPRSLIKKENNDQKNKDLINVETNTAEDIIYIYTDGSCTYLKNGLIKAGYGIYIPEKNIRIGLPLKSNKLTNNCAELTAIIETITYLNNDDLTKKICIFTDSQYCMYIFHGTGERYESNNWNNEGKQVPNVDLIKKILEIKRNYNVVLLKVRAHTDKNDIHSTGNSIADQLANEGANQAESGIDKYIQMNNLSENANKVEKGIDKDIQMNTLFEFDELVIDNDKKYDTVLIKGNNLKNLKLKNSKLSTWFVKN